MNQELDALELLTKLTFLLAITADWYHHTLMESLKNIQRENS